jgi:hypothetical protein
MNPLVPLKKSVFCAIFLGIILNLNLAQAQTQTMGVNVQAWNNRIFCTFTSVNHPLCQSPLQGVKVTAYGLPANSVGVLVAVDYLQNGQIQPTKLRAELRISSLPWIDVYFFNLGKDVKLRRVAATSLVASSLIPSVMLFKEEGATRLRAILGSGDDSLLGVVFDVNYYHPPSGFSGNYRLIQLRDFSHPEQRFVDASTAFNGEIITSFSAYRLVADRTVEKNFQLQPLIRSLE